MDRLLMKLEYDRGGEDGSMRAAHTRRFTVNISKFPSTQAAHDDTRTDTQHTTRRTIARTQQLQK